ncbi:MAG: hypothetical protein R2708_20285 [Vicinamibacterales bacterium]
MSGDADSGETWVVVRQVAYPHEAHLMRSILAGHGIEAIVPEPYLIGVQPAYAWPSAACACWCGRAMPPRPCGCCRTS